MAGGVTGLYSAYPHLDTDFNWDHGIDTETGESRGLPIIPIREQTTLRHLDSDPATSRHSSTS